VPARDEALADAVCSRLVSEGFPSACRRADPWVRNEDADLLQVYVWVDPEGAVRERIGKGKFSEACKTLVSFVRRIDKPEQFSEMLCASETALDIGFTDDIVTAADGIVWNHDPPNKWRARYVQDAIRQERRNISGPFVSIMEIPFRRAYG
jgi:hypothetical protein